MLPSSGAETVQRERTEQGVAGLFEDEGFADVREAEAAECFAHVWREESGIAREGVEFAAQILGRAVAGLARVGFQRDNLVADEILGAVAQIGEIGGD